MLQSGLDENWWADSLECYTNLRNIQSSFHFNGSDETVEVIFRTVISVNQFIVYGAVADMCGQLACFHMCSEGTVRPSAPNYSETMVTTKEFVDNKSNPPTDKRAQGDLLCDYDQKFASLPAHLQLTKLCSNAGYTNTVERGQCDTW